MHTLHQQIAGSNFMIAFANPDGLLLDIISDPSFSDASNAASISSRYYLEGKYLRHQRPWHRSASTRPIVVHGRDHFFSRYNNLTCIAAPIFAPDGGWPEYWMRHRMRIEARLTPGARRHGGDADRERAIPRTSSRKYPDRVPQWRRILHTLSAGLLAVDNEGQDTRCEQSRGHLVARFACLAGRRFADVFRTKFSTYLDEGRRKERQRLEDDVAASLSRQSRTTRQFPMIQGVSRPRPPLPKRSPRNSYPMIRRSRQLCDGSRLRQPAKCRPDPRRDWYRQGATRPPCPCRQRTDRRLRPVNCAALPD